MDCFILLPTSSCACIATGFILKPHEEVDICDTDLYLKMPFVMLVLLLDELNTLRSTPSFEFALKTCIGP